MGYHSDSRGKGGLSHNTVSQVGVCSRGWQEWPQEKVHFSFQEEGKAGLDLEGTKRVDKAKEPLWASRLPQEQRPSWE